MQKPHCMGVKKSKRDPRRLATKHRCWTAFAAAQSALEPAYANLPRSRERVGAYGTSGDGCAALRALLTIRSLLSPPPDPDRAEPSRQGRANDADDARGAPVIVTVPPGEDIAWVWRCAWVRGPARVCLVAAAARLGPPPRPRPAGFFDGSRLPPGPRGRSRVACVSDDPVGAAVLHGEDTASAAARSAVRCGVRVCAELRSEEAPRL